MKDDTNKTPENNKNRQSKENDNHSKNRQGWVFILIMLILIFGSLVASFLLGQGDELKKIKLPYVALALIGVMFHLANQYRIRREEETFDWKG